MEQVVKSVSFLFDFPSFIHCFLQWSMVSFSMLKKLTKGG